MLEEILRCNLVLDNEHNQSGEDKWHEFFSCAEIEDDKLP